MIPSNVNYRPIQSSDYPFLEDIIRKAWNYDRFGNSKLAKRLAKDNLASCLVNQTFTSIAISDGKPVGIIMGKNRKTHRKPLKYLIRQWIALAQIALSKDGREIIKVFNEIEKIDKNLLNTSNTVFDGELAFFVVDENQRGSGIGKELYQQFLDYLAFENLKTFFLFTDTTCKYEFYDYQGLQRLAQDELQLPKLNETMTFFLYATSK